MEFLLWLSLAMGQPLFYVLTPLSKIMGWTMFRKKVSGFIIVLFILIVIFLFFQWNHYKNNDQEDGHSYSGQGVSQQIEVIHDYGKLSVKQTIKNLKNGTYIIEFPKNGANFSFVNMPTWNGKQKTISVTDQKMEIIYEINIGNENQSFVMDDWIVQIEGVKVKNTKVKISELASMGGSWAASAPLTYQKALEKLQYFVFEKSGSTCTLYWQKTPLSYSYLWNKVPLFMEGREVNKSMLSLNSEINQFKKFPSIILTSQTQSFSSPSLIIAPLNINQNKLTANWMEQFLIANIWQGSDEDKWAIKLLADIITQFAPQEEKMNLMYHEIVEKLSAEEMKKFKDLILNPGKNIQSLAGIDQYLGAVKDLHTSFFQENSTNKTFVPLYFYKEKNLYVSRKKLETNRVYVINNDDYLPLKEIVENLNYKYGQISKNEIYVSNMQTSYRFFINKDFFFVNEEQYGLLSAEGNLPYLNVNNQIYVEKDFFSQVFHVEIIEDHDTIFIKK